MKGLQLAKNLTLPLDAVSRTFGLLAVRGAGKSNTAAVMAEEMFGAGLPFVVIDPVGSWFGLRSASDGKRPGLPIPIFGGKHGDVPLERGAGELIADLVVEKRLTCVLDLSRFESESDKKAFLLAFARRLYLKNENPLHLFLEEADDYIPQKPLRDEAQLLRAWENIVRRGRSRGLGMTLITQRSAAINKMVLTQVETLFAMRTTGPQDIKAIEAWVQYHQSGSEVLQTLASLEDGEAWVWSPHFLKTMSRHQIRRRSTFDSGATPANVRAKDSRPPATLADIDISALQAEMSSTLEKAKAEDPRELRRRIAVLEKALAAASKTAEKPEAPGLTDADRKLMADAAVGIVNVRSFLELAAEDLIREAEGRLRQSLESMAGTMVDDAQKMQAEFLRRLQEPKYERVFSLLEAGLRTAPPVRSKSISACLLGARAVARMTADKRPNDSEALRLPVLKDDLHNSRQSKGEELPTGERRILTAIAQYPGGVSREQLTVMTGYKKSSRDTYLQKLGQRGHIETMAGRIVATEGGLAALGDFEPLPTGAALLAYWLEQLPEGERRILSEVAHACAAKGSINREELAELTGYKKSSRDTYLQKLAARQLVITKERGIVSLSPELSDGF